MITFIAGCIVGFIVGLLAGRSNPNKVDYLKKEVKDEVIKGIDKIKNG